ncbi:hypothetical protein [Virgifigura deserti]|uniref:hypothetical protein n=1 Tax=Virgifigura deserti TaxID=2268457 RepID=UPI003CCBA2EB
MTKEQHYTDVQSGPSVGHLAAAFIAGALAVLVFHQGMLGILNAVGVTPAMPYQTQPTALLGVPQIWSIAFWGGIWGIVFAYLEPHLRRGWAYFLGALLFGAIAPTLVAWFVVSPLKGLPVAGGWRASAMATGLMVNGAWGIGTALFLWAGARITAFRR